MRIQYVSCPYGKGNRGVGSTGSRSPLPPAGLNRYTGGMIIRTLSMTLSDAEIMVAATRAFEANKANIPAEARGKVKSLTLAFRPDTVVITGTLSMGFIPMPFEAHCEPSVRPDGETLALRIAKVKAAFFTGDGSAILSALMNQIQAVPEVAAENDTLLVRLPQLLARRGVAVEGRLSDVRVEPGALHVTIG